MARTRKVWEPLERDGVGPPGPETGGEGGGVEAALEGRARLARAKAKVGCIVGGARGAGVDRGLGCLGVDREAAAVRGLICVAGLIGGADLEAVRAFGQGGVGLGRGAWFPVGAVGLALEGGRRPSPRRASTREGEGGRRCGGGRPRGRCGLGGGRVGVDGAGEAGGALVGVAGLVDRPDLEAVGAVGEGGVGLGRGVQGASQEPVVPAAFEGGHAAARRAV